MAEEKILNEEQLNDEELEQVAGGTMPETWGDGFYLCDRGLLDRKDVGNVEKIRDVIRSYGYKYESHKEESNEYFHKDGSGRSRDDFRINFNKENGTKFIKFTE